MEGHHSYKDTGRETERDCLSPSHAPLPIQLSYISIRRSVSISASSVISALSLSAASSPRKSGLKPSPRRRRFFRVTSPGFWLRLIAACVLLSLVKLLLVWRPLIGHLDSCEKALYFSPLNQAAEMGASSFANALFYGTPSYTVPFHKSLSHSSSDLQIVTPFPAHLTLTNMSDREKEFWKQPEDKGIEPCLNFSSQYLETTKMIEKRKTKYLIVIVSGGLNQQRNQIVDAVVIARILDAALVVPILQVNQIWKDDSEFSDIFDVEHFKQVLKDDVHIVSNLPSTHLMARPVQERSTPQHASPQWFRSHYLKRFSSDGVLLLRGMDGRLSKDLSPDLQKLRCKVAFHALRFTAPIMEIGNRLARRIWERGPYVALHLRLEEDVWVRTGCLPGLGPKYDELVLKQRIDNPHLLTGRSNMSFTERKVAGLCPLNAAEVARLLKGLGAGRNTQIFWAGAEPLGGKLALKPLNQEFRQLHNKSTLAFPGELEPFSEKASMLAAIDYIICLHSDVFVPSHGGNMARALQGHRAYAGFRKHITPNKRELMSYFLNASSLLEHEGDMDVIISNLHDHRSLRYPAFRTDKKRRDVLAYPASECMCATHSHNSN